MPRRYLPSLWINVATLVQRLSTCRRLQVGCVILSPDLEMVLGYGYNGNARGFPNRCDRPQPGRCGCVHAETNALAKAGRAANGGVAVITAEPCELCAKLLINVGIQEVYLPERVRYRSLAGVNLLDGAGLPVLRVRACRSQFRLS